jgi:hypothetical protein
MTNTSSTPTPFAMVVYEDQYLKTKIWLETKQAKDQSRIAKNRRDRNPVEPGFFCPSPLEEDNPSAGIFP